MYHYVCMLSFFIYSSVTVFVIVGGQPTTDYQYHDDDDDDVHPEAGSVISYVGGISSRQDLSHLINMVARQQMQLTDLLYKDNMLEAKVETLEALVTDSANENGECKTNVADLEAKLTDLEAENGRRKTCSAGS